MQFEFLYLFQSLDGFAFTLGADGRFLYVSETVSIYLGLSQVRKNYHQNHFYISPEIEIMKLELLQE